VKVATYNILGGGFENYSRHGKNPPRLPLIKQVVSEIAADFVTLVDTFRWKEIFTVKDLVDHFGYKYVYHIDIEDDHVDPDVGITVLTDYEVISSNTIHIDKRNAIKTTVNYCGRDVDLYSVYFDYLKEDSRLKEAKSLISQLDHNPSIIMGDLNALDPEDFDITKTILKNILNLPSINNHHDTGALVQVVQDMLRGEVLPQLYQAGFAPIKDLSSLRPTIPTKFNPYGLITPILRLDHILVSRELEVTTLSVVENTLTDKASDHYPVTAEIDFQST
jgi:endonuclease/exonuclease/phosphatase family metal-dependent hydrolase